jgi:hypothetical protein
MTREQVKAFMDGFKTVASKYAQENGFVFELGNTAFDPEAGLIKPKLTFKTPLIFGEDRQKAEWLRDCGYFHFAPEDYLRTFHYAGIIFKVVAVKRGARTKLVLCENLQGKKFKFPAEVVKRMLALEPKA